MAKLSKRTKAIRAQVKPNTSYPLDDALDEASGPLVGRELRLDWDDLTSRELVEADITLPLPETVTLSGPGIGIVEQNFDFDLLSPQYRLYRLLPTTMPLQTQVLLARPASGWRCQSIVTISPMKRSSRGSSNFKPGQPRGVTT